MQQTAVRRKRAICRDFVSKIADCRSSGRIGCRAKRRGCLRGAIFSGSNLP